MSAKRDYYEVIGVSKSAPNAEIKSQYRKLTLKFHPDRNKSKDASEHFKEIPKAYAVTAIYVLHHIASKEQQKKLLASFFSNLTDNGVIIIKDLDTKPTWKYYWNYIHDFIMTKGEPVLYRSSNEMKNILLKNFKKSIPFSTILILP